jgi:hypothetical protein
MGIINWYRVARERKERRRNVMEAKFKTDCNVLGEEGERALNGNFLLIYIF